MFMLSVLKAYLVTKIIGVFLKYLIDCIKEYTSIRIDK